MYYFYDAQTIIITILWYTIHLLTLRVLAQEENYIIY